MIWNQDTNSPFVPFLCQFMRRKETANFPSWLSINTPLWNLCVWLHANASSTIIIWLLPRTESFCLFANTSPTESDQFNRFTSLHPSLPYPSTHPLPSFPLLIGKSQLFAQSIDSQWVHCLCTISISRNYLLFFNFLCNGRYRKEWSKWMTGAEETEAIPGRI